MRPSDPSRPLTTRFVLYVEGPSDSDILRTWANLVSPALGRAVEACAVILGGRRPARAVEHFASLADAGATNGNRVRLRGVCVLDRDAAPAPEPGISRPAGLEFFTWERRHIESYLLVSPAIRRCLPTRPDSRLDVLLRDLLPEASDEFVMRDVDAKRLLAKRGYLARALGAPLSPAKIARRMNLSELHPEVLSLLDQVRSGAGVRHPAIAAAEPGALSTR